MWPYACFDGLCADDHMPYRRNLIEEGFKTPMTGEEFRCEARGGDVLTIPFRFSG